jgi:hypothetical protein
MPNLDTIINDRIAIAVRAGNIKLASKLVDYVIKKDGWGYNKLH